MGEFFSPTFFIIMPHNQDITRKLDEADLLLAQNSIDEAIALLEEVHRVHPTEESVLLRLAWANWDKGDRESSIRHWEEMFERELERKVFTGFAYDELVRICKLEGKTAKLVTLCQKAASVQPDDPGLAEELGRAYLLSGEFEKAVGVFSKLVSVEDDNPVYHCLLGEALLNAGRYEEFENACCRAGLIEPENEDRYLFQAAGLYMEKQLPERAKRLLARCLSIAPGESLYHCALGDALLAMNRPADAFMAYEKACLTDPSQTAAYWNRLGNSLMKKELFADAIKAFEAALAFDGQTPCGSQLEAAQKKVGLKTVMRSENKSL
ncbi:MAG: tetratricopeptide repeat protein [Syntrophaceae bacterium]|nr:tetratricopeptide repeat protein [Syntrophaceae bacterium]HOE78964.1 tetratricopeptide repeat protein [Smithellaceae bacterium]HQF84487.1 tetratricopeptide repeat protein [Smithellaceae bacterium]HQG80306.1 tetratricopeptide repeat protein [Smithellaceae bacterium]